MEPSLRNSAMNEAYRAEQIHSPMWLSLVTDYTPQRGASLATLAGTDRNPTSCNVTVL